MRAVVQNTYGNPDVLRVAERPTPSPRKGELLIQVRATTVSPPDCAFRAGTPFATRLFNGLTRPRAVPGTDLAGEVAAVGAGVTEFAVGDRVIASTMSGTHAEYLRVPSTGIVTHAPSGLDHADAVAVVYGAMTALPFLQDGAHLQPGQRIAVLGASGCVGASAVQLAHHTGAHVTGVCSAANADLVRSLGADAVIDYTTEDLTATGTAYDVILDAVGASSFARCRRALTPHGRYLSTVPSTAVLAQTLGTRFGRGQRAAILFTGLTQNRARLDTVRDLAEAGVLRPVIDRHYPLDQVVDAHRYVETGHKTGSVILDV